eukprot:3195066-Pleurochrysis_carterae.AAC.1
MEQTVARAFVASRSPSTAGRRWQRSLFPWLRDWSFTQCQSDPCVFSAEETINGVPQRVILG